MEDGKQGKETPASASNWPNILERNWKTCGLFLQTYTYYRDKGRCPLYLPSARPTGNKPELLPTHLEKTFFKDTVRDKLDQDKQLPKLPKQQKHFYSCELPQNSPRKKKIPNAHTKITALTFFKAVRVTPGETPASFILRSSRRLSSVMSIEYTRSVTWQPRAASETYRPLTQGLGSGGSKNHEKNMFGELLMEA